MKKLGPRTVSILKYLFAFTLLAVVVNKMGLEKIVFYLREVSPLEAIEVLALVTIAQIVSALRMRYFFTAANFSMSRQYAAALYYVGAFYNFLLPGGIGGDAYKVILARKRMDIPATQGIRIMVADRASGLCVIMLTFFFCLYFMGAGRVIPMGNTLIMLAALITPLAYIIASKILLKQLPIDMVGSLRYSVIAQGFWLGSVLMLWQAIGHGEHILAFVSLYCAASIASMIPVSVGGLGIREMTYIYGAGLLHEYLNIPLNPDLCVAISLCAFVMSFVSSLPGLLWLNKASHGHITHPTISDSVK